MHEANEYVRYMEEKGIQEIISHIDNCFAFSGQYDFQPEDWNLQDKIIVHYAKNGYFVNLEGKTLTIKARYEIL